MGIDRPVEKAIAIGQPRRPENGKLEDKEPRPVENSGSVEKKRKKLPGDFSHEYVGKQATITLGAGSPSVVKGKIEKATKYWLKVTIGARTLYINKAYVVSIEA